MRQGQAAMPSFTQGRCCAPRAWDISASLRQNPICSGRRFRCRRTCRPAHGGKSVQARQFGHDVFPAAFAAPDKLTEAGVAPPEKRFGADFPACSAVQKKAISQPLPDMAGDGLS